MASGWRYRVGSVVGVVTMVAAAVAIANHPVVESAYRLLPIFGRLPVGHPSEMESTIETLTAIAVFLVVLLPLYKPQPRRILDIGMLALKRSFVALLALATIGYFDYTYRLPRATLLVAGATLLVAIPAWFVTIRGRPSDAEDPRTVIVGDDPREIDRVLDALESSVFGYVSLPSPYMRQNRDADGRTVTDGAGVVATSSQDAWDLDCLGGLSRLDEVLVEYDVDTAVFAFSETDREEFFGALATCHEYGIEAKIHREKADTVLIDDEPGSDLVHIAIEPWDWQDRAMKRAFDLAFAGVGLLVSIPLFVTIAIAIKIDSNGPLLYSQERTAEFGGTFTVYKFRSMIENAEEKTGATLSEEDRGEQDPRVTRVGKVLRKTHLDELPQLWSILVGDMSVVGPRPERPELDSDIEDGLDEWRRRWFVRPGLTGLAQINDVTGYEPRRKLRYDVEYIQQQSFWFDHKIVIRQIWKVLGDVVRTIEDEK